jgi:hypothetical protein
MATELPKKLLQMARFRQRRRQKADKPFAHRLSERSAKNVKLQATNLLALIQLADLHRISARALDRALAQLREMIEQSNAAGIGVRLLDDSSEQSHLETAQSSIGFFPEINRTAIVRLQRFANDVKLGLDQLGSHEKYAAGWELWPPHGMKRIACPGMLYLSGDQFFELALWKAQELLAAEFINIKTCAYRKCRKLFIPIHGKKYCSVRCGQNTRAVTFKKSLSSDEKKELNRITYLRKLIPAKAEIALAKWEAKEPQKTPALRAFYEKVKENKAKGWRLTTRAEKPRK